MSLAFKACHTVSLVNCQRACSHLSVEETGRNNVDASKFPPFTSHRLSEICDESLVFIMDGLVRWHIDNMRTRT